MPHRLKVRPKITRRLEEITGEKSLCGLKVRERFVRYDTRNRIHKRKSW